MEDEGHLLKMKRLIILVVLITSLLCAYAWTDYTIIGKGSSGEYKCSGRITENPFGYCHNSIEIVISDMLEAVFEIDSKEQIDEKTIKLVCHRAKTYFWDEYIIYKQKCPNGRNVYFFEFPPLYNNQGRTVYKTIKKEDNY